jgi:hypothetical protein
VRTVAEGIAFGSHVANNSSSRNTSNYEGFTIFVLNVDFECALSALIVTVNQPRPVYVSDGLGCLFLAIISKSPNRPPFCCFIKRLRRCAGRRKVLRWLPFSRAIFVISD